MSGKYCDEQKKDFTSHTFLFNEKRSLGYNVKRKKHNHIGPNYSQKLNCRSLQHTKQYSCDLDNINFLKI